jgi:hypothetical protein
MAATRLRYASRRASPSREVRHPHGWSTFSERRSLAPLHGCPPPTSTPAFRRKSVRTLLAAEQLTGYKSRSMSRRVFWGYPFLKETYRNGRAGDLGASCKDNTFQTPLDRGFPTSVDLRTRGSQLLDSSRLAPTVRGMARLYRYERPARGGGGECRCACERTPLRGRRRCAAGGRRM